ncbi:hypothetical protein JCM8547_003936, partial [Rhodosporidiobolus lusitaniae]
NGGTLATLDLVLQQHPILLYLARHGVDNSLVDMLKALNLTSRTSGGCSTC